MENGSILIVDDESSLLEILDQFIKEKGLRVVTAADGASALKHIESGTFDVALVDLKLPDIDGLEIIRRINESSPQTLCVIMTAYASVDSTIEALRLNAFDYILKPFDLLKIAEVIDAAFENLRMSRDSSEAIERLENVNRDLEETREELNRRIIRTNDDLSKANESLKKHVLRLKMLYQMGRDISADENWSDALDRFLMAFCNYLEAEGSALLMFSDSGKVLKVRTSYSLEDEYLDTAVKALSRMHGRDLLIHETFELGDASDTPPVSCLAMKSPWTGSVIPLVFKGTWLGFIVYRKSYRTRRSYMADYHFINTIQTILAEEVANAVNISRLRNLKDFNETILQNINNGVLKTDSSGRVIFANKRAMDILGSQGREHRHFDELFRNPLGKGSLFEHLTGAEKNESSLESVLSVPGRVRVPVRLNTTTVKTDDYEGTTLVAVFEDLTTHKAMEEELRRADRLRSLGELSAGVAHEIRNPLTGIATTAQVLKEQLDGDEEKGKYITVILDEIKRLDDIIRNLLEFARPVAPRPSEISMDALVKDAMMLVSDMAGEKDVILDYERGLDDDVCFIDGDQLKQVILNITMNAIQACEPGGRTVVSLVLSEDPVFVKLEVSDTGKGIPVEIADKLYDPFFTTRADGTGLGLSITRKIIESHGGRIYHESESGVGTKFTVELPRNITTPSGNMQAESIS